jgi:hypothetical protein
MSDELEQLLRRIADWPPEVQQKVIDAMQAIQAEYINGDFGDLKFIDPAGKTNLVRRLLYGSVEPLPFFASEQY